MKTTLNHFALAVLAVMLNVPDLLHAQAPATPAATPAKVPWKRIMPSTPPGFTLVTKDVAVYPEHTVTLTLYVPDKAGKYPAVLDIHGGGWKDRQVEQDKPMMERLAARGFVTGIVAYRLSQEAKYPAAINDCKAAVRYMRAHAAELKIDPEHIGVMGGSAGGHLTGLLAMTNGLPEFEGDGPNRDQSSAVQAAIVMAGSQDLVAANKEKSGAGAVAFLGATYQEKPDLYVQASPIVHVRAGVPPTIFIEGEKDTVKIGRAEMQEKLRALGIETKLYTLKDAPHPFWMSQPWCDETVEIASAFFKKHLGEPKFDKP
ncbi:MAG TPA: alpha/beta hydrolase [Chthoniobacter sp.]